MCVNNHVFLPKIDYSSRHTRYAVTKRTGGSVDIWYVTEYTTSRRYRLPYAGVIVKSGGEGQCKMQRLT